MNTYRAYSLLLVLGGAILLSACGAKPNAAEAFRLVMQQSLPEGAEVMEFKRDSFKVLGIIKDSESIRLVVTLPQGSAEQLIAAATHLVEIDSPPDYFKQRQERSWVRAEHRFWVPKEKSIQFPYRLVVLHIPTRRLAILAEDVQ